jgi:hypothetical protein
MVLNLFFNPFTLTDWEKSSALLLVLGMFFSIMNTVKFTPFVANLFLGNLLKI